MRSKRLMAKIPPLRLQRRDERELAIAHLLAAIMDTQADAADVLSIPESRARAPLLAAAAVTSGVSRLEVRGASWSMRPRAWQ
jgi:hypothetical protein